MASTNNFNFPYFPPPPPPHHQPPPPPHHPITPPPPAPPPHVHPPPAPLPPAPSPSNNNTVIIVVFVACGGLFFMAFLAVALFCFVKKKKEEKKTAQEMDIVRVDEHYRVKEAIVPGPHGRPKAVVLEIEDDIHVDKEIAKTEKTIQGSNLHSAKEYPKALEIAGTSSSST